MRARRPGVVDGMLTLEGSITRTKFSWAFIDQSFRLKTLISMFGNCSSKPT